MSETKKGLTTAAIAADSFSFILLPHNYVVSNELSHGDLWSGEIHECEIRAGPTRGISLRQDSDTISVAV